jgi:glycine cleavage system aminomethyltransferase T
MNSELVGYLSSATFTGTLGCGVGMGYVNSERKITRKTLADASFEVEIANRRYPATASLSAFHDPKSMAVRGGTE